MHKKAKIHFASCPKNYGAPNFYKQVCKVFLFYFIFISCFLFQKKKKVDVESMQFKMRINKMTKRFNFPFFKKWLKDLFLSFSCSFSFSFGRVCFSLQLVRINILILLFFFRKDLNTNSWYYVNLNNLFRKKMYISLNIANYIH